MKRLLALLALAGALVPATAHAIAFSIADANHDGVVTFEEAKRVYPTLFEVQFRRGDPNGDGMLTATEYPLFSNFMWLVNKRN